MSESAWEALGCLNAWQVLAIPRRPPASRAEGEGEGDPLIAQRRAALTSAYHSGGPVAFAWMRESAGGPVRVLAAGQALAAGQEGGQVLLTLPAGGRGAAIGGRGAGSLLARLACWVAIAGIADGLLADAGRPGLTDGKVAPSLDDGLLGVWPGPFAWLVFGEPTDPGVAGHLAEQVAFALGLEQRYDSPGAQLKIRRLRDRYAELRQSAGTGLWRVHLLAGATTPLAAAQVAGLVCASADLAGLPYALMPMPGSDGLEEILSRRTALVGQASALLTSDTVPAWPAGRGQDARPASGAAPYLPPGHTDGDFEDPQPQAPFFGSTALLAALAQPPAKEAPGVRLVLRPQFDVTPETSTPPDAGLPAHADPAPGGTGDPAGQAGLMLGVALDRNRMPAGALSVPAGSLNRHTFVCGATGAGKSQTVRGLLEAAAGAGIPWLVVEPAKAEYRLMAARLPSARVVRIAPGQADQVPAGINPLEPAAGPDGARFPLQAHADLVRALFLAAFEAEEPFPQVMAAALTRCYEQAGWDLALGEPAGAGVRPGYPTLGDLQAAAEQVVTEIGYGKEITDNVRGFIKVRISSLRLGTTGRFFEGGHPLDFGALLDRNVVLEIEDVGDDQDKAFLMGTVLIGLAGYLRMRRRAEGPAAPSLRHLTVIEEAHRLLRNPQGQAGPAAHAVEMFAGLLAEVRAYGEGLVIAEQIPAKLVPDVIKNTAVKIVHRLPAADDRQMVGATMNITPAQSQFLVTLVPGEAAVFADGMDYPLLARMPDGTDRENATPAVTAPADAIIGRRSVSCGPACRQTPCTMRQMRAAQRAAGADPRITLWAELSVLAHLTGWTMPMPAPGFAAALRALDNRLRDCALSHAADEAAATRAPAYTARVGAPALAAHVTAAMRAALDHQQWLCDRAEPAYLAPCYRWALVLDSLTAYCRDHDPNVGRHPASAEWEAAYGQHIPGITCADQLATVRRWHQASQRDHQQVRMIGYGARSPAAIERAIGTRADGDDWPGRLTDALTAFRDCRWPADYLTPATEPGPAP